MMQGDLLEQQRYFESIATKALTELASCKDYGCNSLFLAYEDLYRVSNNLANQFYIVRLQNEIAEMKKNVS